MHSKSDNIEIMNNDKADKIIEELFQTLFSRYKIGLVTAMKGSNLYVIVLIYRITNAIK